MNSIVLLDWSNFSVKNHIVNILGFASHIWACVLLGFVYNSFKMFFKNSWQEGQYKDG